MESEFLGDAVYVGEQNGIFVLTTGSHKLEEAEETIYLDPSVVSAFLAYMKKVQEKAPK